MENQAEYLPFRSRGEDVTIWPRAKILDPEVISIGDSVIIDDYAFLSGGRATSIGSFVHIAAFALITGGGQFVIGDFSGISGGARVYTGTDDLSGESLTGPTVPYPFRKPIRSFVRMGRHVVVGTNAVILNGVEIGDGAIIGASSLITKDCEPWTVYVGAPAKPVKRRPSEKILQLVEPAIF